MKALFIPCLAALVAASGFAAAPQVNSAITAVTVYTDRAIVTRTAKVDLPAGQTELVVDTLPVNLVDQSIQVSGEGTSQATILDVSVGRSFVDFTPNERVKALEDELKALMTEIKKVDDRGVTLAEQREFVRKMIAASTSTTPSATLGAGPARPGLDEWQKLYGYTETAFDKLATDFRAVEVQRDALNLKKAALEKQLGELRGAGSKAFKTITVRVSATSAGSLDLSLAYTVPGASWTPAYDARLRTETRTIDMTYYGVVRQNTGEDWKSVSLTLSTARPALGGNAPEPRPWIVNAAGGEVIRMMPFEVASQQDRSFGGVAGVGGLRGGAGGGGGRGGAAAAPPPIQAELAMASVDSSLTSATFKVSTPVSLASNNNTQKLAVTAAKLPATFQYNATPKIVEAAFLVASASNNTDFPFLAGSMNTFLDNTFVATSTFKSIMPGEKFDIPFGADESISVKRKLVNRFTEDTGLTNSGKRVTYTATITITNNKKTTEKISFKEPVPVSRDEKIVVKILTPADRDIGTTDKPKDVIKENDGGVLVWKIELKPGEKREIPVKISVDHPNDVVVTGLE